MASRRDSLLSATLIFEFLYCASAQGEERREKRGCGGEEGGKKNLSPSFEDKASLALQGGSVAERDFPDDAVMRSCEGAPVSASALRAPRHSPCLGVDGLIATVRQSMAIACRTSFSPFLADRLSQHLLHRNSEIV